METGKRQRGNSFATIRGGAKVPFGETVFVFSKLPPAAYTIPGYEINLRQCHDSYLQPYGNKHKNHHDKHFTTRWRQFRPYGNQASRQSQHVGDSYDHMETRLHDNYNMLATVTTIWKPGFTTITTCWRQFRPYGNQASRQLQHVGDSYDHMETRLHDNYNMLATVSTIWKPGFTTITTRWRQFRPYGNQASRQLQHVGDSFDQMETRLHDSYNTFAIVTTIWKPGLMQ